MKDPNFLTQEAGLDFNTVVGDIIKHSCIVDFGIIQSVVADGVVDVSLAVSKTAQDIMCMTCVLANIASSSVTFHIKPNVGDRVLVVYPRLFDDRMFAVPSGAQATEVIVNPEAKGYNLTSGIAILINQYKQGTHKNLISIEDGKVTIDNEKTKVEIDTEGNVSIEADGKYTIKNNDTDLAKVLDGLAKTVENLSTQGTAQAQRADSATKTAVIEWRTDQLNKLFEQLCEVCGRSGHQAAPHFRAE